MGGRFWYDQPTIGIPGDDARIQPVTARRPPHDVADREVVCVCTAPDGTTDLPHLQAVYYAPLPSTATTVEVTLDDLDPVTVPVTPR